MRGAREIDERRRTYRVRWSEVIERNEADGPFSTACTLGQFEELICAIMRGETLNWPRSASAESRKRFLEVCSRHGVAPLVYRELRRSPLREAWPNEIRCNLKYLALREAAVELHLEREMLLTLESLAEHDVHPLLIKGSALAYTHYPDLGLRPRADTDLFIQESDIVMTEQVLAKLGFVRLNTVRGKFIMQQCTYFKEDGHGVRHLYDVHWKISNAMVFSDTLSYNEMVRSARPVSGLGKHARTLDPVHALLLACLHRIAHHHNSNHLIWLYDIHLLVSHMKAEEREAFPRLASDKRLRAVCASSLRRAQQCFATPLPADFMDLLDADNGSGLGEATARFLNRNQRPIDILLLDLRSLSRWREKLCLVKEHVFPPFDYMLNRYSTTNHALLPVLYMHRALRGSWKLWSREAAEG